MLYAIALILLALWVFGYVTAMTGGGFIHVLLVIALVMVVFEFVNRRRAL